MCGNPDFLPCVEAIRIAIVALAGGNFFTVDNFSMRHFHPAQHPISTFDEDPAFDGRLICRRIGNLAAERSIDCQGDGNPNLQNKRETKHPAEQPHAISDAELWDGVLCLVVILKPQMRDKLLSPQMA